MADMLTVREAAAAANVELRGDDGTPYHCGNKMQVRSGIFGPDYAACDTCGGRLVNAMSPHINGGYGPNDEWMAEHGEKPMDQAPCWLWLPADDVQVASAR